jgi:ribosome maturation factor RimP
MGTIIPENIGELIKEKLDEQGFELFDLRYFKAGVRAVLRVTIDGPHGVTIGECERISNELSILLDVEDFSSGRPYTLEISSPGIDRPLKNERDFKRTIGRTVTMQMAEGFQGKKTMRGTVVGCANGVLRCEIDGSIAELPISFIASGKEELEFK